MVDATTFGNLESRASGRGILLTSLARSLERWVHQVGTLALRSAAARPHWPNVLNLPSRSSWEGRVPA